MIQSLRSSLIESQQNMDEMDRELAVYQVLLGFMLILIGWLTLSVSHCVQDKASKEIAESVLNGLQRENVIHKSYRTELDELDAVISDLSMKYEAAKKQVMSVVIGSKS